MSMMFLSFIIGLEVWGSIIFLLGGIILGIGIFSGNCVYTINQNGIEQRISSLDNFKWIPRNILRKFSWDDIAWYRIGSDMNRSFESYDYLKIKLKKWPYSLQLTNDKANADAYDEFVKVFENYAAAPHKKSMVKTETPDSNPAPITKKPDFYDTFLARIIFFIFMALLCGIIYFMLSTGNIKVTYVFRIGLIMIPGLAYFYYRIFVKHRRKN